MSSCSDVCPPSVLAASAAGVCQACKDHPRFIKKTGPIVCACVPVGSCAPGCIRILFFLWMCLAWGCLVPCRGASIWCHVSATSRKVSAVPLIIQKWFGGLWLHCWACRCMGSLVMMCCDTFRSFLPQVMQPGVVGSRQFCM